MILGIDIGGSGIKGAPVDVRRGRLLDERLRLETPQPATPEEVGNAVRQLVRQFGWKGPIGCTFPAVIRDGVAYTAANVDRAWIGTNVAKLLKKKTGCPVTVLNDADAAGLAEMRFGAGGARDGLVLVLTIGTGIGSALFLDGQLLPNTELGHLEIHGVEAERRASDRVRKLEDMSWKKWSRRLNEYLSQVELLLSPDLIILSGGVSKKHARFLHRLETRVPIAPAEMLNDAGIVGAALAARQRAAA